MKRNFLLFALALACGAASAQSAGAVAGSISGAQSTASTTSQAVGGDARATNGAANAGNAQNITFNSTSPAATQNTLSGTTELRTVATVYAPPVGMTATCIIGASAGATGLGWGVAFGSGLEDKGCTRRENVRTLVSLGKAAAGVLLMCNDPEVAVALGADCPAKPEPK